VIEVIEQSGKKEALQLGEVKGLLEILDQLYEEFCFA
jgi:hypothetical protein